jgi:hypothetical protein
MREVSTNLWLLVAIATDMQMAKAAGLYLLEVALSNSAEDCLKRLFLLTIQLFTEPIRIDIAHVQWGLAHSPDWDRFDRLAISRDIMDVRPDLHEYYRSTSRTCIEMYGRGIFYDES